ncbi:MAG: endonuclease/exonuclease/phosphatase family protein [Candidatus Scalindua sediminis]
MNKKSRIRCGINKISLALCAVLSMLSILFYAIVCVGQEVTNQKLLPKTQTRPVGYETPRVLKAHEILPPELLEGERFSVHEDVVTDGFTNYYTIMSPFGTFEVEGDAMLPIRIHEIRAIAALQDIKKTEAFGKAAKLAASSSVKGAWRLISHPVNTVSGVPKGVGRLFSRVGEMFKGKRGDSEDSVTKELFGFSRVKRQYAHKFGVDVYSSNKVLQKELNSVSWAGFAGGAGVSLAMFPIKSASKVAYISIKGTKFTYGMNKIMLDNAPEDLRRINREKLKQIGIEDLVIEEFLLHPKYSPRHKTFIVHALAEMEGVKKRDQFIKQAIFAESELDAFFFQRIAETMYDYHTHVKPFSEIIPVRRVVAGYTADQTIVVTLPMDYLCWTERAALGLKALTELASTYRSVKPVELWVTGRITPVARHKFETGGLIVKELISEKLMATAGLEADLNKSKKEEFVTEKDNEESISQPYIEYQEPEFLSFEELKGLYFNPLPEGYLKGGYLEDKVYRFFRTPIISNRPYYQGVKPHRPVDDRIGPTLRVVSWNIEKSIHIKDAIAVFSSEEELHKRIDSSKIKDDQQLKAILNQRKKLATADIIVLQEMEIGLKRSGYLNAAGELAKALEMNYVYAPQYLEIDPVQLGLKQIYLEDGQVDEEATNHFSQNEELYKGVFGSAVLSRYPIKSVTVIPLRNQGYDWYSGEKERTTFLEKTRRVGSKAVFLNEITREIKTGGRHFFRVDLDVPDIPGNTLTIINIHLEIKCLPKARDRQIKEILNYVKGIDHPVIMLGDFNAAPVDLSPTSILRTAKRQLKNPKTWLSLAPHGFVIKATSGVANITKNLHNPLAPNVPVIAPNPVKKMFDRIEDFRFDDGKAFDFRGDAEHSVNGKIGKLANANQKDIKAFKTTYSVVRPLLKFIGKYRLDWIFVKSNLKDPLDRDGSYRFAPHYGETLTELNNNLYEKISDHDPNVVDIPFLEPSQWNGTDKSHTSTTKNDRYDKGVRENQIVSKN